MSALKHIHKINASARWWIKADGTDIKVGLRESVKNVWSGDVDWGDGNLQREHTKYLSYLQFVRGIGCKARHSDSLIKTDLNRSILNFAEEIQFLRQGYTSSKTTYEHKRVMLNVSEEALFALGWDVEGYKHLIELNASLSGLCTDIVNRINGPWNDRKNVSKDVAVLRKKLEEYVKGIYIKKREAASHLLLFMVSDEQRNFKPYAVPVRVLKYSSIKDSKLRSLQDELKVAMKGLGMIVVGW